MSENATPWERETSAVTAQIETFFVNYNEEEAKKFEVKGCLGRKRARTVLRAGQRAYRRRRSKEAAAYERAGARFDAQPYAAAWRDYRQRRLAVAAMVIGMVGASPASGSIPVVRPHVG